MLNTLSKELGSRYAIGAIGEEDAFCFLVSQDTLPWQILRQSRTQATTFDALMVLGVKHFKRRMSACTMETSR